MYVDESREQFINLEQENTICDLGKKVLPINNEKNNEILVSIDGSKFTSQDFKIIQQLGEIIKDSGQIGKFKLSNLTVEIFKMNEYQNDLIII